MLLPLDIEHSNSFRILKKKLQLARKKNDVKPINSIVFRYLLVIIKCRFNNR